MGGLNQHGRSDFTDLRWPPLGCVVGLRMALV
jgi:hypothetical protein